MGNVAWRRRKSEVSVSQAKRYVAFVSQRVYTYFYKNDGRGSLIESGTYNIRKLMVGDTFKGICLHVFDNIVPGEVLKSVQ